MPQRTESAANASQLLQFLCVPCSLVMTLDKPCSLFAITHCDMERHLEFETCFSEAFSQVASQQFAATLIYARAARAKNTVRRSTVSQESVAREQNTVTAGGLQNARN